LSSIIDRPTTSKKQQLRETWGYSKHIKWAEKNSTYIHVNVTYALAQCIC